jgi:hypothetical protein
LPQVKPESDRIGFRCDFAFTLVCSSSALAVCHSAEPIVPLVLLATEWHSVAELVHSSD